MAIRSRSEARARFSPDTRIELLEADMDKQDRRHEEIKTLLTRIHWLLVSSLVSLVTGFATLLVAT